MTMTTVSIVGAAGYTGGEALRLLLQHPHVTVKQVTSESNAGKFVHTVHPNLRKRTDLKFSPRDQVDRCDVLFIATPHGAAMHEIERWMETADIIIDLSSDFRLRDAADYPLFYEHAHPRPDLLARFVYGIPELHREEMRTANYISSAGCLATAAILGLYPLYRAGIVDLERPVVIEGKTGSSGAGGGVSLATHHPERSGAMRSFKPTAHRHTAEIRQELTVDGRVPNVWFSATSIEAVRGILSTAHVTLKEPLEEKEIWKVYRAAYKDEPFMRIVKERQGIYRVPEPKILTGSNYCDVGFERDPLSNRLVVVAALDNLMKGASGQGVQTMNIRLGLDETTALDFPGLHPI
jgi:LysW-gamma-L-alpha-aminoadipyl-6-phosphate/LysW-L-glutamyl-5-phosphate reductase